MDETAEQQTLFTQQDLKYMVTFILTALEGNWDSVKDIFNRHTISSAFSKHFCFGRLDKLSVFDAAPPPLTLLLKRLHCSYVNCNEFHKHERLFMIMVQ